ncbi:putative RWD, RING finger and WD repeat-containing protein C11E3.05 [Golovinomyces cichoracearum]|uniref:Putative RWD, RING finger and WD repeat-containing protein C11E3.05 n=1 Tax=Golovinomyces cichoracearum TaxID=62708 RepID=A0A420IZS7_9PEZI|nr:putative RWD, RING finger and WD repeat-containing protein C11E3.05 [Golovinomyces cichoracearum]
MDISKRETVLKSVFDSTTFDIDFSLYIDRIVGSASISPSGRDIVLASTDGLDIIDLDSPFSPPRHLRNGSPWLVADVQWSPFAARDYWVVSTANQKVLVWNLNKQEDTNGCVEHTLTAHQRAITDINFSAHHPDILATCAVDGYVHLWDLRRPKKPVITFTDWFGGATQVKCNRQNSHIFASSHDRWLRIWDDRKSSMPLRSINAHASKIYGVDWNRTKGTSIVTCSLDKTIKFWDYSNQTDEEEHIIRTGFPVWRARHTPFGFGLLAMSHDAPGDLHLYEQRAAHVASKDGFDQAVKIFPRPGNGKVKEFLWRSRGGITESGIDNRDFQLISWGDDNILCLQKIQPQILEDVGYIKGKQIHNGLNITRRGATYKTFRVIENMVTKGKTPTVIARAPKPMNCGFKMNSLGTGFKKKIVSTLPKSNVEIVYLPGPAMKTKSKAQREEKDQRQTDWMSGIKTIKQKCNLSQEQPPRRSSLLQSDFGGDRNWNQLESLHDEIIKTHYQLPTIVFDDVDMERRMIVASINVPWADDSSSVYIKLTILFPERYPQMESPAFSIEKTSLISTSTHARLSSDVQQIAGRFAARGQGCLETVFRYLLGELNYEAAMLLNEIRIVDEDFSHVDESSSDDESNFPVDASIDTLPSVNHNANVPLPRLCGAVFSTNGRLVCFFSSSKDKVKSLLATFAIKKNACSNEDPFFEKFGRLKNDQSLFGEKSRSFTMKFEGQSDTENSDDSDTSKSIDFELFLRHEKPLFFRNTNDCNNHSPRCGTTISDSQLANGDRTAIGSGNSAESWASKPKSILAIYSVEDLLPSKTELAKEYIVFGDCSKVCEHNSATAKKYGFQELADVWKYIEIILSSENLGTDDQDLDLKKTGNLASKESCSDDITHSTWSSGFLGRMRWGTHPLAGQLIQDLFSYFESQADVQMLAMMSCILGEPATEDPDKLKLFSTHFRSSSIKTPRTSDYPSVKVTTENTSDTLPSGSKSLTQKYLQMSSKNYDAASSVAVGRANPPDSISYSFDKTVPHTSGSTGAVRRNRKSQSLSASPVRLGKRYRRVNSVGLASTFAASFYRFTSSSLSPPKPSINRKKFSPVEQILSSLAPSGITWGNTTILSGLKEHKKKDEDSSGILTLGNPSFCSEIQVITKNEVLFNDSMRHIPLIDPKNAALYSHYRNTYAGLLYAWDSPLSFLETLKYNTLLSSKNSEQPVKTKINSSTTTLPNILDSRHSHHSRYKGCNDANKKHGNNVSNSSKNKNKCDQDPNKDPANHSSKAPKGLDITSYCIKHESCPEPLINNNIRVDSAGDHCKRRRKNQCQLRCTICLEPASTIFCPCLFCGCISHIDCLNLYYTLGNTQCPGGCDCDCLIMTGVRMVESGKTIMS